MSVLLSRLAAYGLAGLGLGAAGWLWLLGLPLPAAALASVCIVAGAALLRRAWGGVPAAVVPAGMQSCRVRVTPAGALFAMDAVAVLAAATAGFFVVDGFAPRLAGVAPHVTDPLVADVIAVMFLPAALVLAGFISMTGGQTVAMGPEGIALSGPFGTEAARWDEVTGLAWRDEHVIVTRVGVPMARRLRTNLDLHLADGRCLTILEPATRARRGMLEGGLMTYAPERLTKPLALSSPG